MSEQKKNEIGEMNMNDDGFELKRKVISNGEGFGCKEKKIKKCVKVEKGKMKFKDVRGRRIRKAPD